MVVTKDSESRDGIDPAELMKQARARSGLSQRELARRAGTSQSVVARIEVGTTTPTVATLNRLLEAAGLLPSVELRDHPKSQRAVGRRISEFFEAQRDPAVASVYLFGSRARGAPHGESDVDVAVLLDRSVHPTRAERTEVRVDLSSKLVSALGTNDVDLVVLNDLPPHFARAIVLDGIQLARAKPELDHAFVRDVQLRAADLEPFLRRMRTIKLEALRR